MDYSRLGNKRNIRRQNPHTARVRNKVGLLVLRITLGVVLVACFAVFSGAVGLYLGILNDAPDFDLELLVAGSGYHSSFIICGDTGEELLVLHGGQNHQFVPISQIPLHVQHAFIAIEDERFFDHNGVDIRSIVRATRTLIETGGARTEGASTITQQLIKNTLDRFDSNFIYKLQEQYIAISLERYLYEQFGCRQAAKEFILESYLNIINLGRSNYGVQAAAQFYYGLDVWELSIAQAATIAAITQNPTRFPPDTRPEANWERAQLVLYNMHHRLGLITEEEYYEALNSNVYDTIIRLAGPDGGARPIISPFDCFTDALLDQVRDDLAYALNITPELANRMIFTGGLRIYTTQNRQMQAAVDRVFLDESYWPLSDFSIDMEFNFTLFNAITNQTMPFRVNRVLNSMDEAEAVMDEILRARGYPLWEVVESNPLFTPQPQAAFVLMDHHTGHVLALRGVRGERGANRTFNRATSALRSPGSQLKPIGVFAAAFDMGLMQPATTVDDIPFTHVCPWGSGTWTPGNWWNPSTLHEGFTSARRAIYRSANVASARATIAPGIPHVGTEALFSYLRAMGISTIVDGRDGPAVSLGGMRGVYLIELAGAYSVMANGGYFNRPVLYTMVLANDGSILLENRHNPVRVVRDTTAYLIIDSMKGTVYRSGATGHNANWHNNPQLRRDIPIAGKTGTSQDRRDLGFSGSTAYFTASIWMGNDSNHRLTSQANPAHSTAWRSIMQEIHEDLPPRDFERPARIQRASVCQDSGLLATHYCRTDPRGNREITDIFDNRHIPTQHCNIHRQMTYCREHGHLASVFCPPHSVVTRVGIVRPVPITGTGTFTARAGRAYEFPAAVLAGIECPYHIAHMPPPPQETQYDQYNPFGDEIPIGALP